MKVYEVQLDDLNPCIHQDIKTAIDEIQSILKQGEVGKSITIVIKEMTKKEYNQLPEWDGY